MCRVMLDDFRIFQRASPFLCGNLYTGTLEFYFLRCNTTITLDRCRIVRIHKPFTSWTTKLCWRSICFCVFNEIDFYALIFIFMCFLCTIYFSVCTYIVHTMFDCTMYIEARSSPLLLTAIVVTISALGLSFVWYS